MGCAQSCRRAAQQEPPDSSPAAAACWQQAVVVTTPCPSPPPLPNDRASGEHFRLDSIRYNGSFVLVGSGAASFSDHGAGSLHRSFSRADIGAGCSAGSLGDSLACIRTTNGTPPFSQSGCARRTAAAEAATAPAGLGGARPSSSSSAAAGRPPAAAAAAPHQQAAASGSSSPQGRLPAQQPSAGGVAAVLAACQGSIQQHATMLPGTTTDRLSSQVAQEDARAARCSFHSCLSLKPASAGPSSLHASAHHTVAWPLLDTGLLGTYGNGTHGCSSDDAALASPPAPPRATTACDGGGSGASSRHGSVPTSNRRPGSTHQTATEQQPAPAGASASASSRIPAAASSASSAASNGSRGAASTGSRQRPRDGSGGSSPAGGSRPQLSRIPSCSARGSAAQWERFCCNERMRSKLRLGASVHDCYELLDQIGKGGFSVVLRAKDRSSHAVYACKKMPLPDPTSGGKAQASWERMQLEVDILCQLQHDGTNNLHEFYLQDTHVYLLLEYAHGGDLMDCVIRRQRFGEADARRFFRRLLEALDYLHDSGIIHRDLKPENILLPMAGDISRPKLADFGLAARASPPPAGAVGTLCYVAPEILRGEGYGAAVDLWAAGVTLHIVLSGFMPFYHPEDGALAQVICAGQLDLSEYPWQWTSEGVKDLLRRLLEVDPKQRLTAKQALHHPWLKGPMPFQSFTVKRLPPPPPPAAAASLGRGSRRQAHRTTSDY